MNRRSILLVALLTLAAVLAAWLLSEKRAPQTEVASPYFLPELQQAVNEVARIEVRSGADTTTIVREGSGWALANRGGYPADFEKVKRTVVAVAELRTLEPKTANPEMYWRIGVQDPEAKGSTSRTVSFLNASGETLASLVIGNTRQNRRAPELVGGAEVSALYVRRTGEEQSYLVAGSVEVSARPADWVDRRIADVKAERVREVRIERPGATPVVLLRASPERPDLELQGIPQGSVPKSQAILNSFATLLSELRFEDVDAQANVALPESATRMTLRTYDGLVATVSSAPIDGRVYARFQFTHDPAGAQPVAPPAPAPGEPASEEPPAPPVQEQVASLGARVGPWVYVLPEFKASMLARSFEDLITTKQAATSVQEAPPASPFLGE